MTSRRNRGAADILNDVLNLLGKAAALVLLAALAYTAYAVFSGGLKDYPQGFTPALSSQLTHNAQLAANTLIASSVVLCLSLVVLQWGWEMAAPLILTGAAVLYIGLPYFGVPLMSAASMSFQRANHPGAEILAGWRGAGMVAMVAAGIFFAGWTWERLQASLSESHRAANRIKIPFYSACWQTHHCKDSINRFCKPGRRGFHASCWRYKSGCFCDESIGDAMLAQGRKGKDNSLAALLGPPAHAPEPTLADRFRSTHHRAPFQRIACADCPIYDYHELQKHRIIAPAAIVAVPALMYYYSSTLHAWFVAAIAGLDRFALHLAFDPRHTESIRSQIHTALDVPVMEGILYAVIGLILVTVVARATEYWCFSLRL